MGEGIHHRVVALRPLRAVVAVDGGNVGQPYRGPDIRHVDYGLLGYYKVTIEVGRRTEQIQRGALSATVAATALWSLLWLYCFRQRVRWEQEAKRLSEAGTSGDGFQPRPPSQQVSTME